MARRRVGVCRRLRVACVPDASVVRPASMSSWTLATSSLTPRSATCRSLYSNTSAKFRPVSMWRTGKGIGPGQKAFLATWSITAESLPPEKSRTGRANSAATSRKMWMAWASRARRCESR